jgi:hypothetical protein
MTSAPAKVASPNVLRMFFNFDPLAKRAPKDAREDADEMPGFQAAGMGRTVSVGHDSREARSASPGYSPSRCKGRSGLPQPPLTRRFLVLKLFAPLGDLGTVQIFFHKVMFGPVRVVGTSRTDHDVVEQSSMQVRPCFHGTWKSRAGRRIGEADH